MAISRSRPLRGRSTPQCLRLACTDESVRRAQDFAWRRYGCIEVRAVAALRARVGVPAGV